MHDGLNGLELMPADMNAVVARTNLKPNLENLLLPLFEAISNSLHSLVELNTSETALEPALDIVITTNPFTISVADNGSGLNKANMKAFRTPFTGNKLRKGGKGFGRFIGFKVFSEITYYSKYKEAESVEAISFRFDLTADKEISFHEHVETIHSLTGTKVRYENLKAEFQHTAQSIDSNQIADQIIRYFLPYFIAGKMPKTSLQIDETKIDPVERFGKLFQSESVKVEKIEIDGEVHDFEVGISQSKKGHLFPKHALLLYADDRIIGLPRSIENKLGTPSFEDDTGNARVVIVSVSGEFLNNRANTARTAVEASEDEIDQIANFVCEKVLEGQIEYTQAKRSTQKQNLNKVFTRNPLLRTALAGVNIDTYIKSKPLNWGPENFVSDLSLKRYRNQGRWEREFAEKTKDAESLRQARDELLSHIEQENKEALAAYVAHRRTVIDLSEKVIGTDDKGKSSLEDVFHDIIYPRHKDSDNIKFYQHNLWLIDERLSFVSYISSDRTVHGGRRKAGDKVSDLIMYDECSVYENSDSNSLVLVEFKRPRRNDYKFGDVGKDPIQQVLETANKIREHQSLITSTGSRIPVPDGTKIYAFIIADIEPTIQSIIDGHDMDPSWDQLGYYKYHSRRDVFVELFGYAKLIADAKKRNAVFFDILLGDLA